jgi:tetraacyldisaccharide 4'-kinase
MVFRIIIISAKDILDIKNKSFKKIIITTEKDYVRLQERIPSDQLFYLPIKVNLLKEMSNLEKQL